MPPSGGGYLKSLYMKLEDIASRHHPENMICPGIYHLLNLVSKKKGTPQNFLIGQILPAVSSLMGHVYICPHNKSSEEEEGSVSDQSVSPTPQIPHTVIL